MKKQPKEIQSPFSADFTIAWDYWKKFKKEQFYFSYKPMGEQAALDDLWDISGHDESVAKLIIKQSIRKGWRGLFALKDNYNGTNANRPSAASGNGKTGTSDARIDKARKW